MTVQRNPIHSQSARFLAGGAKRVRGTVMLFPGEVAAVANPAEWLSYALTGIYLTIALLLFHTMGYLGIAIGSLVAWGAGHVIIRTRAIRKAAAGGGVTVIPLDLITSIWTRRLTGIAGRLGCRSLLVATADGAEHEFRGKMGGWPSYLTGALTARGREVRATPEGVVIIMAGGAGGSNASVQKLGHSSLGGGERPLPL